MLRTTFLPYGVHLLWTASAASTRLPALRRIPSRESRYSRSNSEATVEEQWSSEVINVVHEGQSAGACTCDSQVDAALGRSISNKMPRFGSRRKFGVSRV
jgi:hypothetical protein